MQLVKKEQVFIIPDKHAKKPKYKSHNPITIAIPKAQQELIKAIPRRSYLAFINDVATPTDWYNLCFRIRIGYDLADKYYTQEAVDELKKALDAILAIKDTYLTSGVLSFNLGHSEVIGDALDYTDEMCDQNTRRAQLDAFHASDRFIKTIVKEINARSASCPT